MKKVHSSSTYTTVHFEDGAEATYWNYSEGGRTGISIKFSVRMNPELDANANITLYDDYDTPSRNAKNTFTEAHIEYLDEIERITGVRIPIEVKEAV